MSNIYMNRLKNLDASNLDQMIALAKELSTTRPQYVVRRAGKRNYNISDTYNLNPGDTVVWSSHGVPLESSELKLVLGESYLITTKREMGPWLDRSKPNLPAQEYIATLCGISRNKQHTTWHVDYNGWEYTVDGEFVTLTGSQS